MREASNGQKNEANTNVQFARRSWSKTNKLKHYQVKDVFFLSIRLLQPFQTDTIVSDKKITPMYPGIYLVEDVISCILDTN